MAQIRMRANIKHFLYGGKIFTLELRRRLVHVVFLSVKLTANMMKYFLHLIRIIILKISQTYQCELNCISQLS